MAEVSKSFLIVADGEFLSTEQLLALARGKVIVALDHAGERLLDLNILPDIILGDFDSIREKERFGIDQLTGNDNAQYQVKINGKSIQLVYRPDQDETDFFKAIRYIDMLDPADIYMACALSRNRLDHLINNLRSLRVFYQKKRPIYFYTKTQIARYIKDETIIATNQIGAICGIFGFPKAHFSSEGLKYNGNHFPLSFGFSESVANEFAAETAKITVMGEALFIQNLKKTPS
jgi:thiamine pyrophosphokinase